MGYDVGDAQYLSFQVIWLFLFLRLEFRLQRLAWRVGKIGRVHPRYRYLV